MTRDACAVTPPRSSTYSSSGASSSQKAPIPTPNRLSRPMSGPMGISLFFSSACFLGSAKICKVSLSQCRHRTPSCPIPAGPSRLPAMSAEGRLMRPHRVHTAYIPFHSCLPNTPFVVGPFCRDGGSAILIAPFSFFFWLSGILVCARMLLW